MAKGVTVDFNANVARFTKGTNKAVKDLNRFDKKAKKTGISVGKMFAGLATGVAITSFVRKVQSSIDSLDKLGKSAKVFGFTTSALQEYRFVAEQSGVATTLFDNSMIALTKRLGEAKANTGPLVSFFKKYDTQLLKNIASSEKTEDALKLIFEAMNKTTIASEKAAIANAAFSRSGVALVNMAKDYETLRKQAQELGIVIDKDLVDNAEDAADQLNIMSRIIDANLTVAFMELAPLIIDVGKAFAEAAPKIAVFVREMFNIKDLSITGQIKDMKEELAGFEAEARKVLALPDGASRGDNRPAKSIGIDIMWARKELKALEKLQEDFRKTKDKGKTDIVVSPVTAAKVKKTKKVLGELQNAHVVVFNEIKRDAKVVFDSTRTDVEKYQASIQRLDELLLAGAISQDTFNRAVAEADDVLESASKKTEEVNETARELGFTFSSAFEEAIVSGNSFREVLRGMAQDILRIFARKAITEPLASGFSSVFSNFNFGSLFGFADGGRPRAGVPAIVGERGPELFIPDRAGTIIPNHALGGGGGPQIIQHFEINVNQAMPGMEILLRDAAAQGGQEGFARVASDFQRNGPLARSLG